MNKIKVKLVKVVTVIDPDSALPVDVTILKLQTGGMIGIDSSFLENTEEPVFSPFDSDVELDFE